MIPQRSNQRTLGAVGEAQARLYLEQLGYMRVAENWHASVKEHGCRGELDLVMLDPVGVLVFIEVKRRRSAEYGSAVEAVTVRKQEQVRQLAEAFLSSHPQHQQCDCRFDVIALDHNAPGRDALTHFKACF